MDTNDERRTFGGSMKTEILNCKIGDVIQHDSPLGTGTTVFAIIIGESHRHGWDRWLIQPLDPRRKPYNIKKKATVWKKVT